MLECLIYLVIWAILALAVLYVLEAVAGALSIPIPPPVPMLLRLLVGLFLLVWVLNCLGLISGGGFPHRLVP